MKNIEAQMLTIILTGFSLSPLAMAASKKASDAKKPTKMTCEDFLTLEDVVRPKLVYWANGFNWWGRQSDPYVDVEETDSLVPIVVQECTKTPKTAFLSKVKEISETKAAH